MTETKPNPPKVLIGTRLSSELYKSFVNYLQNESKIMPSNDLLTAEMGKTINTSAKKTDNTIRKKFRNWTKRMVYSNGVLIHKPTKKMIIPEIDFSKTIKSIHESTPKHLNVIQTVRQIQSRFTWTSKNFGMNLSDVLNVLCDCDKKLCRKRGQNFAAKRKNWSLREKTSVPTLIQDISITEESIESVSDMESHMDSELFTQLFDELISRIRFMSIYIKLSKVCRLRKNTELKESLQICSQLIHRLRSLCPKPELNI